MNQLNLNNALAAALAAATLAGCATTGTTTYSTEKPPEGATSTKDTKPAGAVVDTSNTCLNELAERITLKRAANAAGTDESCAVARVTFNAKGQDPKTHSLYIALNTPACSVGNVLSGAGSTLTNLGASAATRGIAAVSGNSVFGRMGTQAATSAATQARNDIKTGATPPSSCNNDVATAAAEANRLVAKWVNNILEPMKRAGYTPRSGEITVTYPKFDGQIKLPQRELGLK